MEVSHLNPGPRAYQARALPISPSLSVLAWIFLKGLTELLRHNLLQNIF